jgi:hypothetical protein
MAELLTKSIADEYRRRAMALPPNGLQDIGKRRELRQELQRRCGITELMALNIINGYHTSTYVVIEERKALEREREANNEN